MAKRGESPIELLMQAPWWISAVLAAISYIGLKFIVPSMFASSSGLLTRSLARTVPSAAPFISSIFIFTGFFSIIGSVIKKKQQEKNDDRRKELFNRQKSLVDIGSLTWREFEELIGEAYRRQGFQVEDRGGRGPDEGIDLILKKSGETVFVQCKHWDAEQVGVKIVRELYGVMAAKGANKGILVTTGYFTRDAELFAHGKPIALIRGNELSRLIEEGQRGEKVRRGPETFSRAVKGSKQ